mgnify:CR=1 FL=1
MIEYMCGSCEKTKTYCKYKIIKIFDNLNPVEFYLCGQCFANNKILRAFITGSNHLLKVEIFTPFNDYVSD